MSMSRAEEKTVWALFSLSAVCAKEALQDGIFLKLNINLVEFLLLFFFFTCASLLLLLPWSSLPLCFWSVTSDLVALLSFGEDTVSAASDTFIVSVSTVSDILIAKSYWERLANTENLKETEASMRDVFFRQITRQNHRGLKEAGRLHRKRMPFICVSKPRTTGTYKSIKTPQN